MCKVKHHRIEVILHVLMLRVTSWKFMVEPVHLHECKMLVEEGRILMPNLEEQEACTTRFYLYSLIKWHPFG
jgi:hypothetical protein